MTFSTIFRKKAIAGAASRVAALMKGDEGAVSLFFAISASMMVGSMVMLLSMIAVEMNQTNMQMATDVASLSSGANVNHYATPVLHDVAQWQKDAQAYFNANMSGGYEGLTFPSSAMSRRRLPATRSRVIRSRYQ